MNRLLPSLGIDLVEIQRFVLWHAYQDKQLRKIFSHQELVYCRMMHSKQSERFAIRFAAKEALFKALAPWCHVPIPLLTFFNHCELHVEATGVSWKIDWLFLQAYYSITSIAQLSISTSLTHTNTTACAVVLVTLFP